jgi:hypothetical protein
MITIFNYAIWTVLACLAIYIIYLVNKPDENPAENDGLW